MIAFLSVGYAGMGACEAMLVEDSATEDEIQQEAYYLALQNAEMYGFYPPNEGDDEDAETENSDQYSSNIEGYAVDYVPDRHDGQRSGGGSFEQDFAQLLR